MIYVIENKISEDECKFLIKFYKYASWLRQEAKVTNQGGDKNIFSDIRKSEYIRFFSSYFPNEVGYIYKMIYQECQNFFNYNLLPVEQMHEDIKIIKYRKGDFFDWHYDCFNSMTKTRKINFTIQLSDESEYEGGDLEFFKLDITRNKKRGTLILYPAYLAHRITMITKGKRYAMVGHLNGPEFR